MWVWPTRGSARPSVGRGLRPARPVSSSWVNPSDLVLAHGSGHLYPILMSGRRRIDTLAENGVGRSMRKDAPVTRIRRGPGGMKGTIQLGFKKRRIHRDHIDVGELNAFFKRMPVAFSKGATASWSRPIQPGTFLGTKPWTISNSGSPVESGSQFRETSVGSRRSGTVVCRL